MSAEFSPLDRKSTGSKRSEIKAELLRFQSELPEAMILGSGIESSPRFWVCLLHVYYKFVSVPWAGRIFANRHDSNLYILLYRSAYVRGQEGTEKEEGQIAVQAACRITAIAEDMLSHDLIRRGHTHL